jgi:hypothetical protein
MIVYGDRERTRPAQALISELISRASESDLARDQVLRRSALAALAIDTGALAQALIDHEFAWRGEDELSSLTVAAVAACRSACMAFVADHRGQPIDRRAVADSLRSLRDLTPAVDLTLRDPEGYAFYALYPELYVEAAAALHERDVMVIGIRSIGTSLAPLVAAALDTPLAPVTVRPVGHPFARALRIGEQLESVLLLNAAQRTYAIVDEGPGLSGSSFEAVASFLCARGVRRDQLVFFPSHDNPPGERASQSTRQHYQATRRSVRSFEDYFDGSERARSPADWFDDVVGRRIEPVHDLGGGRWRALLYRDAADYPPSYARDERRKLLVTTARGRWLLKYSGLGGQSHELTQRARVLSDAGLTPQVLDVRHGFTLCRFEHDLVPLAQSTLPRAQWIASVIRYLCVRAKQFPVGPGRGASPRELWAMITQNASELWGAERCAGLSRYEERLRDFAERHAAVATDNKLELYEWLVGADGRVLKCDAIDHAAGHDCIGCQDPAWDVAGATIELGFSAAERELLCASLFDTTGHSLPDDMLRFYELAYCAFRAGRADFGERSLRGWADDDADRIAAERTRYAQHVLARLDP